MARSTFNAPILLLVLAGTILVIVLGTATKRPTTQFDYFLLNWQEIFPSVLKNNCSQALTDYRNGTFPDDETSVGQAFLVAPVVDCVLNNTPAFRRAEISSSAVVLGLAPSILQPLALKPFELALLSLRRPLLAFLLRAGNPVVGAAEIMQFGDPSPWLADNRRKGLTWAPWYLITALEYLFVCVCIANVAHLAYELGVHAVVTFAPSSGFFGWALVRPCDCCSEFGISMSADACARAGPGSGSSLHRYRLDAGRDQAISI